ncbi:hypothetical protein GHT09_005989 [Marmota monax]|uniref:Uncharacterized protein n=1 Tax=Marmota monax TaxID=9995 RepID=A0A834QRP0_MARMO|nr:hypothetical protein GHT09_005989 [Marmota monax]
MAKLFSKPAPPHPSGPARKGRGPRSSLGGTGGGWALRRPPCRGSRQRRTHPPQVHAAGLQARKAPPDPCGARRGNSLPYGKPEGLGCRQLHAGCGRGRANPEQRGTFEPRGTPIRADRKHGLVPFAVTGLLRPGAGLAAVPGASAARNAAPGPQAGPGAPLTAAGDGSRGPPTAKPVGRRPDAVRSSRG